MEGMNEAGANDNSRDSSGIEAVRKLEKEGLSTPEVDLSTSRSMLPEIAELAAKKSADARAAGGPVGGPSVEELLAEQVQKNKGPDDELLLTSDMKR